MDVSHQFQEIRLLLAENGLVAVLKKRFNRVKRTFD
jgi:hypothetical protein